MNNGNHEDRHTKATTTMAPPSRRSLSKGYSDRLVVFGNTTEGQEDREKEAHRLFYEFLDHRYTDIFRTDIITKRYQLVRLRTEWELNDGSFSGRTSQGHLMRLSEDQILQNLEELIRDYHDDRILEQWETIKGWSKIDGDLITVLDDQVPQELCRTSEETFFAFLDEMLSTGSSEPDLKEIHDTWTQRGGSFWVVEGGRWLSLGSVDVVIRRLAVLMKRYFYKRKSTQDTPDEVTQHPVLNHAPNEDNLNLSQSNVHKEKSTGSDNIKPVAKKRLKAGKTNKSPPRTKRAPPKKRMATSKHEPLSRTESVSKTRRKKREKQIPLQETDAI